MIATFLVPRFAAPHLAGQELRAHPVRDLGVAIGGPLGGLVAGASNAGPFALGAVAALIAIAPLAISQRRELVSAFTR